ncbi:MAG TPA: hypothetical protein VE954_06360 [Oligoflexus sp.]|uniref:HMA2 domain-containing protein n=1 Tax=Oligoflexus sp. TaxID=1971216 RepID=UPI002D4731F8|nr:hypothetical protein [Oligoflexus sp.]HYX32718.1 hypothetical protein [Oligoflexus sp.]
MDCFIHQTHGRMRVRIASLKGNLPFCRTLVRDLSALPGVQRVAASEVSGSVVVYYNPTVVPSSSILRVFQRRKLLANVIAFPNASARPLPVALSRKPQVDDWVNETVSFASRTIMKTLLEAALQKTGRILLKKILP